MYLGICNAKCDGSWICCDTCGGWKCYGHWYAEYGVDLDEYEEDYVDFIYFNCDICLNLIIDTMNMQIKHLQEFQTKYFGQQGISQQIKLRNV